MHDDDRMSAATATHPDHDGAAGAQATATESPRSSDRWTRWVPGAAAAEADREGVGLDWRGATPWIVTFAAWTVVGLLGAAQSVALAQPHLSAALLRRLVLPPLLSVWLWALYTPLILEAAMRLRLDRRRWPRSVALHVLGIGATVVADVAFDALVGDAITGRTTPPLGRALESRLFIDSFSYAALVAVGQALRYARLYRQRLARESALEQQLLAAENSLLRMQLDPHFLFNTLNAIAELVHVDPDAADAMITRLGALLRTSADALREPTITLGEELEFVTGYLEIMQLRLRGRLTVDIDVPAEVQGARIPPFLLQPIVENAIRHGIERRAAAGRVEIEVRRDPTAGGRMEIQVRDDGAGLARDVAAESGIGLRNTRLRLRHLYGDDATMSIRARIPHGVVVALRIPVRATS